MTYNQRKIPYFQEIVQTNQPYSYEMMRKNLRELKETYPFLEIGSIGQSVLKKDLPYVRIGAGPKKVLYHAGIHGNEWITSVLLMKYIEAFCQAYSSNGTIAGYSAKKLFQETSIYMVPMVNPDTIDLVVGAIPESSREYRHYQAISCYFPNIPFPDGWKANFNGVDLNLQFPAGWRQAQKIKFSKGYRRPAPRDFVGRAPLTDAEAIALYQFTLAHNFALTISYHTQGEEIYWQFLNYMPKRGKEIGELFAKLSDYHLTQVPFASSFAGYKDWFLQTYNKPAYTIEAGLGENPLSILQFNKIYQDNLPILVLGAILA